MKRSGLAIILVCSLFNPVFGRIRGQWGHKRELLEDSRRAKMKVDSDKRRAFGDMKGGMMRAHMISKSASTTNSLYVQNGVFDVELSLISTETLKGYTSPSDFANDLTNAAKSFANQAIEENANYQMMSHPVLEGDGMVMGKPAASPSAGGKTDYGTNNQETGVDEGDFVKSDGTHVYIAYGNVIVVLDAVSGVQITNVTMPDIPPIEGNTNGGPSGIDGPMFGKSMVCCFPFQQEPTIRAMFWESDRLVVIVDGYGYSKAAELNMTNSVLSNLFGTHVRVYDTSTLSASNKITLIKKFDTNGAYQDSRAIGDNIHLVTTSYTDSWTWVSGPLQRWNFPANLTDEEYTTQAKALAEELFPLFVDQLMADVNLLGTPNLVKVSVWDSIFNGNVNTLTNGVFQAYMQVTSFSATDPQNNYTLSGSFLPSGWGYTYSTPEMLIFSTEAWDYLPTKNTTGPTTYFLGMKLVGATSIPAAIGSAPGSLLNQYSVDIYDGHLRVGTTVPALWTWPEPVNGTFPNPVMVSTPQNQVVILKIPTLTVGQVGVLEEVGRISNLGKEGESITGIRFFDNVAYAVTFLRTDPFYVLSLDVADPHVLAELNITGFTSYLHSLNANNNLILGVGEEANSDGVVLGVKVALFDVTDLLNPILLHTETVENNKDTWSSSTVSWDPKAFRYLSLGNETGIAILPMQVSAPWPSTVGNFDGYFLYDISRDGISKRGEVSHVDSNQFYGCYSNKYLAERTFVFNGQLMSFKGHSVLSTNLDTFATNWEDQLDDGLNKGNETACVYWMM